MPDSFSLAPGFGFRRLTLPELQARTDLLGLFQVWERPRTRGPRKYIMGVDVGDGLGQDRSVVSVHRMGTIDEPEEQVALYISDMVPPQSLAFIIDAIGRWYVDEDGFEAMAAIECNNHGLSVQDTLQLHLAYGHFMVWEYLDAATAKSRFSTRIGWVTTARTRPLLLDKLYTSLTNRDPVTNLPDLIVHSPFLIDELRDFQTETVLAEATAAKGAHDDCVTLGTLIRTKSGMKPIELVTVGEEVLTHAGRYRPVLRVGCRETDHVYEHTITGRLPLWATGNHRLLVCYRQPYTGKPHSKGGTGGLHFHDLPEWLSVDDGDDLTDFAAVTVPPADIVDVPSINLIDYAPVTYNVVEDRLVAYTYDGTRVNPKQNRPPASIAVDADFCRLLGYYYAEGARGRHNVAWGSHAAERGIHAWVLTYLQQLGLFPALRPTSHQGVTLSVGSVPLNRFFAEFGSRDQKQFPLWVETLPPEKQQHIVAGWLLGDGCFRNAGGGITAVTISPHGATQLWEMSIRCGWPVTIRNDPPQYGLGSRPLWIFAYSSIVAERICSILPPALLADKRPVRFHPKFDRTRLRIEHGYLLGHIRQVTRLAYDGPVFNLEVEEDHSYVANGTVVHNCVISTAIAHYASWRQQGGEQEPLSERRHRLHQERAARAADALAVGQPRRDWRNTAVTAEEQAAGAEEEDLSVVDERSAPIFLP
jgi:hypothetical protein